MPVRYLLDTNTVSYIIRGNIPQVRERLLKMPMAQIAVSAVTEGELRFGVARRPGAGRLGTAIEEFLLRVEVLPWDSACAQQYGALRAALEAAGAPMGNLDLMIAAQALAARAILVTHDRVFRRVRGLKTEDWCRGE